MATITFKSIEEYAKRLGVRVERRGKKYETFKESDHGTSGETDNLIDLINEVRDFAIGNTVYLDGAKPVEIIGFEGDQIHISVGPQARAKRFVPPDRLSDKKTAEANFGVFYSHRGDGPYTDADMTRRDAEESIRFLKEDSTIRGRLEFARLIQFLS